MKLDLFQRAVLYALAWFLENGDQRFKTGYSYALSKVLHRAAESGELNGNIADAVKAEQQAQIKLTVDRIMK